MPPSEGIEMVNAQKKTGRIIQVGSQRVSSVICAKAKELLSQGIIGDLNLVEGSLGRNDPTGCWEYPPPPDLSPQTLDWDTWQNNVPKVAVRSARSLRAGAAGGNTAQASPATCSCIWSAA